MNPLKIGRRLYRVLDKREKSQARWLIPLALLRAIVETVGIASILPFVSLVADPEAAMQSSFLATLYSIFGFESVRSFLLALGSFALLSIIVSNVIIVATTYLLQRFAMRQKHLMQVRLVARNLGRPYEEFLDLHSSELQEDVLNEANEVVEGVLAPFIALMARAFSVVFLLVLLLIADPALALLTGAIFGIAYGSIYRSVQSWLARIGDRRHAADKARFRTVGEIYAGIKDIKATGREQIYLRAFEHAAEQQAMLTVKLNAINLIPKAGLEVIAFGSIVGIVIFLVAAERATSSVMSTLTLYAFASYRILPAFQNMVESLNRIRFSLPSLDVMEAGLSRTTQSVHTFAVPTPRGMERELRFEGVSYEYPGAESRALRSVDLNIPNGTTTAIVGKTGSGKSTIVDLTLGLLRPTEGHIIVDEEALQGTRLRSWRAAIGYVPQSTFLTSDSIAANIAFGVPPEQVDMGAVKKAAKTAQASDFIDALPQRYETKIGERGIKISGGQRQRIGIARALYRNPDLLVFDEATSALDLVTERAVFDALRSLASKTIIVVTHRLRTIAAFDQIVLLESGRIVARGTYESLVESNPQFGLMTDGEYGESKVELSANA